MVYRGRVQNGLVVLDRGAKLEEGQTVSVRPLRGRIARPSRKKKGVPTLYDLFKPVIGIAKGLPSDFSRQHDHYLYGTPKRR